LINEGEHVKLQRTKRLREKDPTKRGPGRPRKVVDSPSSKSPPEIIEIFDSSEDEDDDDDS